MKTNKITLGILAHVDAGKTTLSESILFLSGRIRKLGRVDHKNAFLDTFELERARGITIFSKQAVFNLGEKQVTLLDTPGHIDFSSEMERTLQVLDYAILVINGADGIQGHTLTLWKLLAHYRIPVFIFVNKMDQVGTNSTQLMQELEKRFGDTCIDFSHYCDDSAFFETIAMCDDLCMEQYIELGHIEKEVITSAIRERKIFPVYFGSALKLDGVSEFLKGLEDYTQSDDYSEQFGARVFKITRDSQGNRLTHMKITQGRLQVKDSLSQEKVDQIRLYSGVQFELLKEAEAGTVCAVTGLSQTFAGEGLGIERTTTRPILQPVLTYKLMLPVGCDIFGLLLKLRQLEEEEPHLNIVWNENLNEIHAQVMGAIEIEILKSIILERFNVEVDFGSGSLIYKETITQTVEGIGHFEPLKHYAEVHVLLEPGDLGSGMTYGIECSEDDLDRNWQRLILSHLEEKKHIGILTGSEITDMKITLIAGRGHLKHTEGGDFRQATYRAVRQGLKKTKSILLEPIYEYRLEVPKENAGRAMSDIQKMKGNFGDLVLEGELAILEGTAPVATMRDYLMEVNNYTKGMGRLFVSPKGYEPCHNEEEIICSIGYEVELDNENPTSSVFCAHGAGFSVPWDKVEEYMHIGLQWLPTYNQTKSVFEVSDVIRSSNKDQPVQDKELEDIFFKTYGASKRDVYPRFKNNFETTGESTSGIIIKGSSKEKGYTTIAVPEQLDKYLLVDGYNIIFAWDDLSRLAQDNLDAARMQLLDGLCNYQSFRNITVIVVFDAYRVIGNRGEASMYHNIHVIYTKEAETADQYIERLVNVIGRKYDVTVATSDALEQMIILGKGASRLSAAGLKEEVNLVSQEIRTKYLNREDKNINQPFTKLK